MRAAGHATRERILAAAKAEFTQYGFAGARLNRIASNARASKERLYSYFTSKEHLFEAVVAQWIEDAPYRVPLTAEDVAGYVEALFDNFVADPRGARLQRWIELEAPSALSDDHPLRRLFRAKLAEVRRGQREGLIDPGWHPMDLLTLLTEIVQSMAAGETVVGGIVGTARAGDTLDERRAATVEAARRLVSPDLRRPLESG
ncbi:TetR family transcriptional regulator [Mycobacterium sp. 3519A]|jgi:AcrR family transcriptional regulator|uniref:TetR family transcriptional regulator n=1 Tax=Mycobacterium sp. 3519A TaxID=2057184 RepID=UPI000C7C7100|nr:TetR family transcriptional regulator [Mycobacterium sp. 3519A]